MEPLSSLMPNSDGDGDEGKERLMALSVTELVSILRTAYRTVDFDRVEEVLVDKEFKLKSEFGKLSEKLDIERLDRMSVEEELKKYKVQCEKGKIAEERYEKLLQAVKKNRDLDGGNTVTELRNKNRKLEDEKRRAETETGLWKRKFEELNKRLLTLEKGANSSMNGYSRVEIRANAEAMSEARRNTDQLVSPVALGEMELNEVVKRAVESGNTLAVSSPPQRMTEFVNVASENVHPETEDGHDDMNIKQHYSTRSQSRGSYNEVQDSPGKSLLRKMPEGQAFAKIDKRNRGKETTGNTSGLKTQASKKAKMDVQHQRKINGNEIASPTVQNKTGRIVETQSQEGSCNEMVIDDATTQALETQEEASECGMGLTQMLDDYMSQYLTPSKEKKQEEMQEVVVEVEGEGSAIEPLGPIKLTLGQVEQLEHCNGRSSTQKSDSTIEERLQAMEEGRQRMEEGRQRMEERWQRMKEEHQRHLLVLQQRQQLIDMYMKMKSQCASTNNIPMPDLPPIPTFSIPDVNSGFEDDNTPPH